MQQINNLERLAGLITETNRYFLHQVQKQVNTALTLRNWLIGCHIFQYDQLLPLRIYTSVGSFTWLIHKFFSHRLKNLPDYHKHLENCSWKSFPSHIL